MRRHLACAITLAVAAGLVTPAGPAPAWAAPVSISTLPPGAINNVQAQVIAKVVQERSGLQMRVVTFNAPSAILGAVQNRQAEFTFTSNDEAGAAYRGKDEYAGQPMRDLRIALTVIPFTVGIMVKADSPIKTMRDMKGRRFATGWQGFRQGIPLANAMLATAGLSLDDVEGVPAANLLRAADDFKAGKTDGAQFAIGAPKVAEIHAAVGGVRFLPLEDTAEAVKRMQAIRPEYHINMAQPSPVLPGVVGPTPLLGYYINILTHQAVPEDVVHRFVKALHGAKEDLAKGHPSFRAFDPQRMAEDHVGMDYHPGAVRFYREAGLWKGGR